MKILSIALLGAALFMSDAVAAKDGPYSKQPANADQYFGVYQSPSDPLARSNVDGADSGQSGTRGREGLGGDSFHPEGPGNVTN
jgi:hypothetical protein